MLLSPSGILAEAKSTLIKTFSIVLLLLLYYTFITYNGRKSNKQQAKSNEQRTKSNKQRTKSNKQQHSVHPPPPHLSAGDGVEPPTKFSKRRGLPASQFLGGVAGKERVTFFRGGGGGVAAFK